MATSLQAVERALSALRGARGIWDIEEFLERVGFPEGELPTRGGIFFRFEVAGRRVKISVASTEVKFTAAKIYPKMIKSHLAAFLVKERKAIVDFIPLEKARGLLQGKKFSPLSSFISKKKLSPPADTRWGVWVVWVSLDPTEFPKLITLGVDDSRGFEQLNSCGTQLELSCACFSTLLRQMA